MTILEIPAGVFIGLVMKYKVIWGPPTSQQYWIAPSCIWVFFFFVSSRTVELFFPSIDFCTVFIGIILDTFVALYILYIIYKLILYFPFVLLWPLEGYI